MTRVTPLFFKARFDRASDPKCSVLDCFYFSRHVLSQSPLVTAIRQDGQPMAQAPSFVHWMVQVAHLRDLNKARLQTSIFYRLFVSYKSLVSCLLASWKKLVVMFQKKTSHLRKVLFLWRHLAIWSGIFS